MGFYRAPKVANWEDSRSLLRHLSTQLNMSWVCIGDLNKITCLGVKSGGPIRPERQMKSFKECLDFCALKDLSFLRLPFTWCNKRFDGCVVWGEAPILLTSFGMLSQSFQAFQPFKDMNNTWVYHS